MPIMGQGWCKGHPFQGVFYLQFSSINWVYAHMRQFALTVRSTRSRACGSGVMLAGPARCTKRATNGKNPRDLMGLACLAQARQDPERGGCKGCSTSLALQLQAFLEVVLLCHGL